jgi:hypothetical protein
VTDMDCDRAQEILLLSDDPAGAVGRDAALAQHVGGCADCQSLVARLGRIEAVAAALPAVVEGSEEAKARTLERVRATERTPATLRLRRPIFLRPAVIGAVAAALVVGIGITAWMWPAAREARQQAVVEELIDFDQAMAEASPQEREQLYAEQAPVLRSAVERAPLSAEERRLAKSVLETSATAPSDPVAQAERLNDLSELILRQIGPAAAANDDLALQRLGRRFGKVQRGIRAHLDDRKDADVAPERSLQQAQRLERMEMVRQRQEEARKRLQRLAERSPERAQKVLQRMLENERQRRLQQQQGGGKRPATKPWADPNIH